MRHAPYWSAMPIGVCYDERGPSAAGVVAHNANIVSVRLLAWSQWKLFRGASSRTRILS